jgi:molecular chaperone HtpG
MGQELPDSKPILEINPEHALIKKLDTTSQFDDWAHVIFDQALLSEGSLPADPAAYLKRVNALLLG